MSEVEVGERERENSKGRDWGWSINYKEVSKGVRVHQTREDDPECGFSVLMMLLLTLTNVSKSQRGH